VKHDNSVADQPIVRDLQDFDPRSGTLLEQLLFNNRVLIALACLAVTLFMGYQATRLELAASFEKMLPTKHPFIVNYLTHKNDLVALGNVVRIAVENKQGSIYDKDYLDALRQINDEIFLFPGVERPYMKSLWTPATRWTGVTEDGLDGGPVIDDTYDGSAEALETVRRNVERSGEIGQIVAENMKSSVVVVPLLERDPQTGKRLNYREFGKRMEQIRDKYQSDKIAIHINGFAQLIGDLIAGLGQVLVFFCIAVAICTALLYWYTRCVRSTAMVVVCSAVAVIWLLGLLPTLGFELDPYSILVPFLVFAIGMSHGAQKMNGITQDIGRGTHRLVAARYTFRRLFMAGLTALVADAVGFAVLMVIQIKVIQDLAITASIGVAVLIFTNLVLLPILLSFTGVSAHAAERSRRAEQVNLDAADHKKHPLWQFLDLFAQTRYAGLAILVALLLGAGGFVVSTHLKIGDLQQGAPELRQDSVYNRDNAFIAANYAASSDIFVTMVTTPDGQCAQYRTLLKVDDLEWRLQQLDSVESTLSLSAIAKRMAVGMNEGVPRWYDVPRNQDTINFIVNRAPRELFNVNCNFLTVYAYLKDHKAVTLDSVVNTVSAFAADNNSPDAKFLPAAGNAGIDAATNIVVKQSNREMLALVYAAVVVLAFIAFRSWRAVLCAILPLMLTSILFEALMVALGIGVKVATLPVIALGVGIGVDYALYVLTVTLSHLRRGLPLSQAYYRALLFTGRVVVLTGVTLGIAVATWAFSPIKFQADMGILLAFMFIWNMIGALVLLPALARFLLPAQGLKAGIRRSSGKVLAV
jgi:predicted RND superfamily exporter protein